MTTHNRQLLHEPLIDQVIDFRKKMGFTAELTAEARQILLLLSVEVYGLGLPYAYRPESQPYIRFCSADPSVNTHVGAFLSFDAAYLGDDSPLTAMVTRELYESRRDRFDAMGCTAEKSDTNYARRAADDVANGDVYIVTWPCTMGVAASRPDPYCERCFQYHAGDCA